MSTMLQYTPVGGEGEILLNKHFISIYRPGYLRCNGTVMPDHYYRVAEDILNLEVRDDDVWVCTFLKAGTTWTQEMIWCIANNLDFERAKVDLELRFPFLELEGLINFNQVLNQFPKCDIPQVLGESVDYIKKLPSPRFIKTHLPFYLLPLQLQNGSTKAKIVHVTRNVKDTCISHYHHSRLLEQYKGNFDDFATIFINDSITYGPFWKHVLSYWERRQNPNILFLMFEELKEDLRNVIQKTATFLEQDLMEEEVNVLCKHLSFEQMKNNPSLQFSYLAELGNALGVIGEGHFFRSGELEEWKGKLSPDWVERFDKWTEENLRGTGFNI